MEAPQERIVRYLAEAHAYETGQLDSLKGMAADAEKVDAEVAALFTQHAAETERQIQRLEARLKALGGTASAPKGLLSKAAAAVADLTSNLREDHDQVSNHLFAAYAAEHLEVATYSALEAAAETTGDAETAALAREIQAEERATGEKIYPHIARLSRKTMQATAAQS